MIKDVVVSLPVEDESTAVIDYAVSAATAFEAHAAGVAFIYDPVMPGMGFDGIAAGVVEGFRAEAERAAQAAVARFEKAARSAGLSMESHLLDAGGTHGSRLFGQVARHFDLSIVAQPRPEGSVSDTLIVEEALFQSGRPVLVVPYVQKEPLKLDRILVCWDGGRAAARAVADAMPFLTRSKSIEVVTVTEREGPRDDLPGFDMAHHLARHGLKVDLKRMVSGDLDAASAILSYAADMSADFIVMGGYGHSRLREFVLGGATRGMLESMTAPTLMSH